MEFGGSEESLCVFPAPQIVELGGVDSVCGFFDPAKFISTVLPGQGRKS